MNLFALVGRIVYQPELTELDSGRITTRIKLAVLRPFKNSETNEYDTDFIPITMWEGLAKTVNEYCKKGTLVCIRGRVVEESFINKDNKKVSITTLIGEQLSILSHPSTKTEEE